MLFNVYNQDNQIIGQVEADNITMAWLKAFDIPKAQNDIIFDVRFHPEILETRFYKDYKLEKYRDESGEISWQGYDPQGHLFAIGYVGEYGYLRLINNIDEWSSNVI